MKGKEMVKVMQGWVVSLLEADELHIDRNLPWPGIQSRLNEHPLKVWGG